MTFDNDTSSLLWLVIALCALVWLLISYWRRLDAWKKAREEEKVEAEKARIRAIVRAYDPLKEARARTQAEKLKAAREAEAAIHASAAHEAAAAVGAPAPTGFLVEGRNGTYSIHRAFPAVDEDDRPELPVSIDPGLVESLDRLTAVVGTAPMEHNRADRLVLDVVLTHPERRALPICSVTFMGPGGAMGAPAALTDPEPLEKLEAALTGRLAPAPLVSGLGSRAKSLLSAVPGEATGDDDRARVILEAVLNVLAEIDRPAGERSTADALPLMQRLDETLREGASRSVQLGRTIAHQIESALEGKTSARDAETTQAVKRLARILLLESSVKTARLVLALGDTVLLSSSPATKVLWRAGRELDRADGGALPTAVAVLCAGDPAKLVKKLRQKGADEKALSLLEGSLEATARGDVLAEARRIGKLADMQAAGSSRPRTLRLVFTKDGPEAAMAFAGAALVR